MLIGMMYCLGVVVLPVLGHAALENLQSVYEREEANIASDFRTERLALPERHIAILRNMEAYFQREGDVDALRAVQQARQKFVLDPTPSGLAAVDAPIALVRLQNAYREGFASAAERRLDRLTGLQRQYSAALARLQADLIHQGKDAEAGQVAGALAALQTDAGADAALADLGLGGSTGAALGSRSAPAAVARPAPATRSRDTTERAGAFDGVWAEWFE